jgi:serine protease Do
MRQHFIKGFLLLTLITNCFASLTWASSKPEVQVISFADIIEPLMPAVVNIYTIKYSKKRQSKGTPLPELIPFEEFKDFFKQFNMPFAFDLYPNLQAMSLGSGFIIEETGLIVTNYHVIAGSDEIHVKLSDNTELPAVIIGRDPQTDLALIKINSTKKLPFVSFGNSNEARVGDVVIAIGNSLGFGGTVTTGIISSKGRDLGSGMDELVDDFIQTDAAINTGNSGGPLFNIEGKVIGINTSIPAVSGGTNVGIGFAIPSNKAQNIVDQLKKNGKISRGKLDIAIQENTKELSEALNIDKDYGVLVVDVKIGGSGDKAGLKRGDLIIGFNEKEVINSRKLQLFVAETKIGEEVKLTIIRNGKTLDLKAQISEVTDDEEDLEEDENNFSPKNINTKNLLEKSGVVFTNVSEDLKKRFSIDKTINGLFVVEIRTNDPAIQLRTGDIVLAINQEPVNDVGQFNSIYKQLKSDNKKNAILLVKRKDFSMFIPFPIK